MKLNFFRVDAADMIFQFTFINRLAKTIPAVSQAAAGGYNLELDGRFCVLDGHILRLADYRCIARLLVGMTNRFATAPGQHQARQCPEGNYF